MVAKILKQNSMGIIGLQEAELNQLADIIEQLPMLEYVGKARDDGKQAGEFSPILFDRNQFTLLKRDTFWFSDTSNIPGSTSWGNDIPRICTWGRFKHVKTGKSFYLYNMHWDHASQQSRMQSGKLLLNKIQQREFTNDPVIVIGDFNTGFGNQAFEQLLNDPKIPLNESFTKLSQPSRGTFHGFTGNASLPAIDSILISKNIQIIKTEVHQDIFSGRYPSDHFPVSAIIELK